MLLPSPWPPLGAPLETTLQPRTQPTLPHTHLLHNVWWEHSRGKGPSEDICKLLVQSPNAHLAEVPVRTDEGDSTAGSNVVSCQL